MAIDYVMIGTNDLDRARAFYDAVFPIVGGTLDADYPGATFCYVFSNGSRAWIALPHDRNAAQPGNGNMTGFRCNSPSDFDAAFAGASNNGGTNEGDPGPRPLYGPHFYGAYVRDPDGNKMSFVTKQEVADQKQ